MNYCLFDSYYSQPAHESYTLPEFNQAATKLLVGLSRVCYESHITIDISYE